MKLNNFSNIKKAVIPVAGLGTRFLPFSKAVPKEMINLVNKPAIEYIAESAANSGIEDIIFIVSNYKKAIEDHFSYHYELDERLKADGKEDLLKLSQSPAKLANFVYINQKEIKGNGHAVLCAKSAVGKEPFIVSFGDEYIDSEIPYFKQMMNAYEKFKTPIAASIVVNKEDVSRYGIIEGQKVSDRVWKITRMVEKPSPEETDSRLAATGCYVLTPEIFEILATMDAGKGGEYWLSDAVNIYLEKNPVHSLEFRAEERFDTGNISEYIRSFVHFSEKDPNTKGLIEKYLTEEHKEKKINL